MPIRENVTYFAMTNFRNQRTKFGIKTDDRRRHMYVIGKTGMGKTNMLENMVYTDIINGEGVCYVDPHGDTAEKILNFIPAKRINDVVYFNPADIDYPIAFNVLEAVDSKYKHLVSSGLVGVFKKIWADSWGPRLEYILRNCLLALLDHPDSTLLGVTRILVDKEFRNKVLKNVKDPVVKSFWVNEYTKFNERVLAEVISPIQNKVGQFLSTALIRNIIGQVKSTINMREIMDNKKILVLNLSKGRIGEDASSLLGAMMITKIQLAAMSRVNVPEDERADFYLYVDEFQNFATESFAGILSEARKYHLNLIMAHQYIAQLEEKVADAVFGNVGTLVTFRVGAGDAEMLVKEYTPFFTEEDLVNLPKYHIYLKLMIDGVASNPFSALTLPPLSKEENNEDKIIRVSRERYAKSREVVEDKIMRWSGLLETDKKDEKVERKPFMEKTDMASRPRFGERKDTFRKPETKKEFFSKPERKETRQKSDAITTPVRENKVYKTKTEKKPEIIVKENPKPVKEEEKEILYEQVKEPVDFLKLMRAEGEEGAKKIGIVAVEEKPKTAKSEHKCAKCGEPVKITFVPDPKKKILCRLCLKAKRDEERKILDQARLKEFKKYITEKKEEPKAAPAAEVRLSDLKKVQTVSFTRTPASAQKTQVKESKMENTKEPIKPEAALPKNENIKKSQREKEIKEVQVKKNIVKKAQISVKNKEKEEKQNDYDKNTGESGVNYSTQKKETMQKQTKPSEKTDKLLTKTLPKGNVKPGEIIKF